MNMKIIVAAAVLLATAGPVLAASVTAEIKTADGKSAGTVSLTGAPTGVLVHVELSGMTPGWHALHFHDKADCSDPKFAGAGAHINMATAKKPHGFLALGGPDYGDLTNIYVGADGTARAEIFTDRVSLDGAGARPALLDSDGSALIVHANPDDYTTQPIGGAGARVACAVIR
jgi:Cu-Zn family superoxide dismutase